MLSVNGKGYVLTGRIQPFALVGIGVSRGEFEGSPNDRDTDPAFAARFGGGVDFYFSNSIAFTVHTAYVLPTGDLDDNAAVSLGVGALLRF